MIILLLVGVWAIQSVALDEPGPPHESLLRAREEFDSILCQDPEHDARERMLDRRYGKRMRAVYQAVASRFGEAEAKRGYITVGSCRIARTDEAFEREWRSTTIEFERVLQSYEQEYNLVKTREDR